MNIMIADFAQLAATTHAGAVAPSSPPVGLAGGAGFPTLFSDEEFEQVQSSRQEPVVRPEHDRQDNAGIRPKPAASDGHPESMLEQRFGHIAKHLVAMWPSEACAMYIKRLVISDRESRQGFPPDVVDDLLMLYQINEMRCHATRAGSRTPGSKAGETSAPRVSEARFDWNAIPDKGYKHG